VTKELRPQSTIRTTPITKADLLAYLDQEHAAVTAQKDAAALARLENLIRLVHTGGQRVIYCGQAYWLSDPSPSPVPARYAAAGLPRVPEQR
jgi:hypothetical protein